MNDNMRIFARHAILFITVGMGLGACGSAASIEGEVLKVQASPDGKVIATLSKAGYGATVSYVYRVYLHGVDSDTIAEIVRADKVSGIDVEWSNATTLAIRMECGRIHRFTNFFYTRNVKDNFDQIAITLSVPGLCREST